VTIFEREGMYERMINPHMSPKYSIDLPKSKNVTYQLDSKSKENITLSSGYMSAIIEEQKFVDNSESESDNKRMVVNNIFIAKINDFKRIKSMKNTENNTKFLANKDFKSENMDNKLIKKAPRSKSPIGKGIVRKKNTEALVIGSESENQIRRFALDHESETPLDQHYFDSCTEESDSNTEEQEENFDLYIGNLQLIYKYR
jgi:hypothetical protein